MSWSPFYGGREPLPLSPLNYHLVFSASTAASWKSESAPLFNHTFLICPAHTLFPLLPLLSTG